MARRSAADTLLGGGAASSTEAREKDIYLSSLEWQLALGEGTGDVPPIARQNEACTSARVRGGWVVHVVAPAGQRLGLGNTKERCKWRRPGHLTL